MPLATFLNGRPPARGLIWLGLSETVHIQTAVVMSDLGGGATRDWVTQAIVPCRIDPLGAGNDRITGGRVDERSTHMITVPTGTTINVKDRADIIGRGTYEVTAVRARTAQYSQVFEVIEIS